MTEDRESVGEAREVVEDQDGLHLDVNNLPPEEAVPRLIEISEHGMFSHPDPVSGAGDFQIDLGFLWREHRFGQQLVVSDGKKVAARGGELDLERFGSAVTFSTRLVRSADRVTLYGNGIKLASATVSDADGRFGIMIKNMRIGILRWVIRGATPVLEEAN